MTRREITPLDIKRIRGVMCLTQREFAALLGVSHDYLKAASFEVSRKHLCV